MQRGRGQCADGAVRPDYPEAEQDGDTGRPGARPGPEAERDGDTGCPGPEAERDGDTGCPGARPGPEAERDGDTGCPGARPGPEADPGAQAACGSRARHRRECRVSGSRELWV